MNAAQFVAKWRAADLSERSASQQHFLDLCDLLGHPKPAEMDSTGDSFTFERGAAKQGGGDGWADVWKKGFFGWEYKGRHKDLGAAYEQLLQYREALENPPLLVVCDLDRILVHANFTNAPAAVHEITLATLDQPRSLEILRAVFFEPDKLKPGQTSTAITSEAASTFAGIADSLRARGLDPGKVAHFLNRLVFCLFAEDIGLLPDKVFARLVERAESDPRRFATLLGQLFAAMASGADFGLERIRHFNGNLFDDASVLDLTAEELKRVAAASRLDWAAVDPSVFGTLFERGLDPAKRSQLGAHYTSREDIETLVEPVVMQPLRREWEETKRLVESVLATGKKKPGSAKPGGAGVPPAISPSKSPREWHSRGYLPHFDHPGLVQTITFRLADSLPADLAARLAQRKEKADSPELRKEIEAALDQAHGVCHLRDPRLAEAVRSALLHFDGDRYRLLAWVIMPNHVHAMIETVPGIRLEEVVHSWKSFSAKECNRLLRRTGPFWQEDYFDRFIRNEEHFQVAKAYIEENPVKAGLAKSAAEWRYGSANLGGAYPGGAGILPATSANAGVSAAVSLAARNVGETPAPPAKPLSSGAVRKARAEADSLLHQFLLRLQGVKVLDPACGSGNFLYVTLQKLKTLEKEVSVYATEKGFQQYLPGVGPWQLYGIEVNPYAHDLAQTSIWIGFLQWTRANGYAVTQDPILRPMAGNFRRMDAILDLSDPANPKEPEWPTVDFIVGNPPFLGGKMLRRELGDAGVDTMFAVWKDRVPAEADLCCYWFEKARAHIEKGGAKRAGLLATQGIRGGANREVLKRIKETGDIFWAESDRPWVLDGANVHVSMVAFGGKGETCLGPGGAGILPATSANAGILPAVSVAARNAGETPAPPGRILDGRPVREIHSNLTAGGADTTTAQPIPANLNLAFMGDTKGGAFDVPLSEARDLLLAPNPDGRPNSDVVVPWVNGLDVTRRPREMWIVDFAAETREAEAARSERPFELIRERVQPERAQSRTTISSWWLHERPRVELRKAFRPHLRFLATARVTKHRLFVWMSSPTLPDSQLIVFARSDDFFFGVLHSRIHKVWALAQGTQLREKESGFRYTPTTCFETFPFPKPTLAQEAAIVAAAKELNDLRERWLNPPEWTREEILEFPATVGGPWSRFIASDCRAGASPAAQRKTPSGALGLQVGTARYPRLVPKDPDSAAKLAKRTLTNLYNERPQWLADAHRNLDIAVSAAYGWPADLSDAVLLEHLLKLNQERSG